jgi:hypothetical protein
VAETLVLLVALAAAYANAFAGGFQFDDWNVVVGDPRVQSLGAWWASMPGIRPLLKLSYAANHASGAGLAGFHAVNLALHASNALLALALLRRLEARRAPPGASPPPRVPALDGPGPRAPAGRAPLVAALVLALHPAQTEAVTYVSGRSTSLAATLVLASALVHVAGRDGWRPRLARGLSSALLAAALGVKELAAALPLVLVAVELADPRRPPSLRAVLRATGGHWLVVAAAAALVAQSPTYGRLADASLALRAPGANAVAHLHGLAWLGGQALRPALLDADPVIPAATRLDGAAIAAALAVAVTLAAGVALLRRRPAAGLALLWTVLWLPFAGLVLPRPEPANDRQLYLSLLGAGWLAGRVLVAAAAAAPARLRPAGRAAAALIAVTVTARLGAATFARNRVYADEVVFWEAVLARSPGNARAENNLGFALAARCRLGEAEAAFVRAAAAAPGDHVPRVNLRLLRDGEPLGEGAPRCPTSPR